MVRILSRRLRRKFDYDKPLNEFYKRDNLEKLSKKVRMIYYNFQKIYEDVILIKV